MGRHQHDRRRPAERRQLRPGKGVRLVVSVYPAKPDLIGSSDAAQTAFANFVALVATTAGPTVTNFIVGNEPNVNRFWQPQYANGKDAAGADYEHTLAKAYDALKAVRPDALVWGPAISSRGNDHTDATSNPSHSPVWFIKDMGDAYRASGRTKPIFDVFDIHPYPPIQDTDPFSKPFQWPQAGAANLDRIKQALWDAFHGTGQPTPAEQSGGRTTQAVNAARFSQPQALPISSTRSASRPRPPATSLRTPTGPTASRRSASSSRPRNHAALMEIAACDPDVQSLFFFPLIDEADVHNGFQSGNLFADLQPKQSYAGREGEDRVGAGRLPGRRDRRRRRPGSTRRPCSEPRPSSAAPARSTRRTAAPSSGRWGFSATASEDANYTATLDPRLGAVGRLADDRRHYDRPDPTPYFTPGDQVQDDVAPGGLPTSSADHDDARRSTRPDDALHLDDVFTLGTPDDSCQSAASRVRRPAARCTATRSRKPKRKQAPITRRALDTRTDVR